MKKLHSAGGEPGKEISPMSSEHSFVMQRTKNTSVEFQELNDIGVYPTEGIFKNYEKGIEV